MNFTRPRLILNSWANLFRSASISGSKFLLHSCCACEDSNNRTCIRNRKIIVRNRKTTDEELLAGVIRLPVLDLDADK